ncbi:MULTISPECIES: alpha/beta hydrolase [Rhizobium/Agrobacterium group]|jgi:esterase/lipase superfamily enzyme|nr:MULTISPECIES: alpha/beta fold hydrolase [Rhizobium/Agrobacterium group]RSC21487.1 alpha/beta fold hydrolase [Agrobacterium sp. FDAARGOS_525]
MREFSLRLTLLLLTSLLAACAGRPAPELLAQTAETLPGAKLTTVYVATTRKRDENGVYTSGRSREVSYIRYGISIPPGHKAGNVEWPKSKPNPKTDFVTVEQRVLDAATFEAEVTRKRNGKPPSVGVFVHGYNTNFTEAVYRIAQMTADAGVDAAPILFAWPSEGALSGYVADKDAVTFSRDQLADLLGTLARKETQGPITLVGHSMGGWLTTEAVRQLRLTGKDAAIRRLQVVLAAPDIDVDVFEAQLATIGPLNPPMTILVSQDDRALKVSEFLSTERQRLGRIDVTDPKVEEATRKANVQVIDISDIEASDSFRHNRFVGLAAYYPKLSGRDGSRNPQNLRQAGAFVFNSAGAVLSSPFVLAGKIVGGN